ncbi:MAG: tripartite tricarboxylate transporter TctB family protein [Pseudaminobacter sp.]|nr:tripartite tricarboxylate transporter TctB family protein [Pseudaminobacter sp.]
MKVNDAATGAIFLAIAIAVFFYAGTFPGTRGVAYGPDLFPRIVAAMMGLGGIMLIVGGLRQTARQPLLSLAGWVYKPRTYAIFAGVIGSVLFYIFASPVLGFLLTGFTMLFGLLVVTRRPARPLSSVIIAAVVTAIIHILFVRALRVPLPYGIIESWLVG